MSAIEAFATLAGEPRFQGWPLVGNYPAHNDRPVIDYFGRVLKYQLMTPRGPEPYVSLLRHFGWVVVFAVTDDGRVITNVQWKPGINDVEWGLSPGGIGRTPAGTTQDDILAKTQQMFTNETGFGGGNWVYLGSTNVESGKIRGADENDHGLPAHMYLATGLVQVSEPTPLPNEIMDKLFVPVVEFFELVLDAMREDGKLWFNEISAQLAAEKAFRHLVRMGIIPREDAIRIIFGETRVLTA